MDTIEFYGKEKISRILLKLAPPVMLAQLIQALYNIVDSFFVGQYSETGLTALSIIFPFQLLMIALAVGTGVGINPVGETGFAPYDGTISSVADSKHAIGITGAGDMELLIHVGVDTVEMNGDGFECLVKTGDEVKAGQPLMKFDRAKIAAAGHPDMVVVLLTNADDYDSVEIHPEAEQEGDAVAAPAEAPAMA